MATPSQPSEWRWSRPGRIDFITGKPARLFRAGREFARVYIEDGVGDRAEPWIVATSENGVSQFVESFADASAAFAWLHLHHGAPLVGVRRVSFSLTKEQIRAGTKDVTRRRDSANWMGPGEVILAIEKGMGIPKGERQVPIGLYRILEADAEVLTPDVLTPSELRREGFPDMKAEDFIAMFRRANAIKAEAPDCVRYSFEPFTLDNAST